MPYQLRLLKYLIPFSLFLLSFSKGLLAIEPIVINDVDEKYNVGFYSYYFKDKTKKLTIEDVKKEKFIYSGEESLNLGLTESSIWLRFSLKYPLTKKEKSPTKWYLEFEYPLLDNINLYSPNKSGSYSVRKSGDSMNYSEREIQYHNIVFDVDVKPGEIKTYYIKVQTKSSAQMSIKLFSSKAFIEKVNFSQTMYGVFYGIILVLIFYNLFIFFSIKEKSYLYYILYIASFMFAQMGMDGHGYEHVWSNLPWLEEVAPVLFVLVSGLFNVEFTREFLYTKSKAPLLNKVLIALSVILFSFLLSILFIDYHFILKIGLFIIFFGAMTILVVGAVLLYRGNKEARFFMAARLLFLSATSLYALKTFGTIEANMFVNSSVLIGSAMEGILMSIALADKINIMNEEKKKSQQEIIKSQNRYGMLVEGSSDIIFLLDSNFNIITINSAVDKIFKINPARVEGKNFLDMIYEGEDEREFSKKIIQEKIEQFIQDRESVSFIAHIKSRIRTEPKEMMITFDYVDAEGKSEILGKASSLSDDFMVKYFDSENQKYIIGNLLTAVDDIIHRITQNVGKFLEKKHLNMMRISLREIIINSIEHGNLNISFKDKTEALESNTYFSLIESRQKDENLKDKQVIIDYSIDSEKAEYSITDEGEGFDYNKILDDNDEKSSTEFVLHGRGITIAKNFFDSLKYNEKGNQVILTKYFKKQNSNQA